VRLYCEKCNAISAASKPEVNIPPAVTPEMLAFHEAFFQQTQMLLGICNRKIKKYSTDEDAFEELLIRDLRSLVKITRDLQDDLLSYIEQEQAYRKIVKSQVKSSLPHEQTLQGQTSQPINSTSNKSLKPEVSAASSTRPQATRQALREQVSNKQKSVQFTEQGKAQTKQEKFSEYFFKSKL
jgi:hypothetical protein